MKRERRRERQRQRKKERETERERKAAFTLVAIRCYAMCSYIIENEQRYGSNQTFSEQHQVWVVWFFVGFEWEKKEEVVTRSRTLKFMVYIEKRIEWNDWWWKNSSRNESTWLVYERERETRCGFSLIRLVVWGHTWVTKWQTQTTRKRERERQTYT